MRTWYLVLTLGFGLGIATLIALPSSAGEPVSAERIEKLIGEMGNGSFEEREKATEELDKIGAPALDSLRKAVKDGNGEVQRRGEELIKKIEKRVVADKVLAPKKIALKFKNAPVSEAIEEFRKKSEYSITLHDPEKKLADRKVTIDTGEITFWEALDQFCEKAGLVEATQQDLIKIAPPVNGPGSGPAPPLIRKPIRVIPADPAPPPAKEEIKEKAKEDKPKDDKKAAAKDDKKAAAKDDKKAAAKDDKKAAAKDDKKAEAVAEDVEITVIVGAGPGAPAPVPLVAKVVRPIRPQIYPNMNGIVLMDGKAKKLPTYYAGAVRIRALPAGTQAAGSPLPEGEMQVVLDVSPEQKLAWHGMTGVRLDKAVDDQGQSISQAADARENTNEDQLFIGGGPGGGRVIIRGGSTLRSYPGAITNGMMQQISLRLKKGERASSSFKELKGNVVAQVQTAPETLVTVDKVVKTSGESFKFGDGGVLKVIKAGKNDKDQVELQVEMTLPQGVLPSGGGIVPLAGAGRGRLRLKAAPPGGAGGNADPSGVATNSSGFAGLNLVDEKGNAIPCSSTGMNFEKNADGSVKQIYNLTFNTDKDSYAGAKLVFTGSRNVLIDIPFTLKDLPLK